MIRLFILLIAFVFIFAGMFGQGDLDMYDMEGLNWAATVDTQTTEAQTCDYYVDINLSTDSSYDGTSCNGDYSIANRECTGSDGDCYESIEDLHAGETIAAGDYICIRGGTYDDASSSDEEHYIKPEASGTSWTNMVTYAAYSDETVNITGRGHWDTTNSIIRAKVVSDALDYIKIEGLNIYNAQNNSGCIDINNSDYWIIKNVNCYQEGAYSTPSKLINIDDSTHVYFIGDGTDGKSGCGTLDEYNDTIYLNDVTSNIIFYNWTFENGTHDSFLLTDTADEVVIWGGTVTNDYHTGLEFDGGDTVLVHDVTFSDMGGTATVYTSGDDNAAHPAIYFVGTDDSIIRLNTFYQNGKNLNMRQSSSNGSTTNNFIYHNTLYDAECQDATQSPAFHAETFLFIGDSHATNTFSDNVIINNIFHTAEATGLTRFDYTLSPGADPTGNTVEYNFWYDPDGEQMGWVDNGGNDDLRNLTTIESEESEWANNSSSDPEMTDPANQDFTLQTSANAVDFGTSITLANGSGSSSTTLTVDDTRGFFDPSSWGFNEADLATLGIGGATKIDADYIQIGSDGSPIQISSIDSNTQITLSSADTWSDNDPVYWCPYAVVAETGNCYKGSAPDAGAYEKE